MFEFFGVVRFLVQHVREQFHIQPRDFDAELLTCGQDMRERGLHAHRIVPEDDDTPAFQCLRRHRREGPIHQCLRRDSVITGLCPCQAMCRHSGAIDDHTAPARR